MKCAAFCIDDMVEREKRTIEKLTTHANASVVELPLVYATVQKTAIGIKKHITAPGPTGFSLY